MGNLCVMAVFCCGTVAAAAAVLAAATWRASNAATAALAELRADRRAEAVGRVVGPARRLMLELEVPSHGGLPRWGFANVDPTHEQVEMFTAEMQPLAELVRHRLLECAATHPDDGVRTAAANVAVRANAAWTSTISRLHGEVAARSGAEDRTEGDRAEVAWRRFCEELTSFTALLQHDPGPGDVDHAKVPTGS